MQAITRGKGRETNNKQATNDGQMCEREKWP
jgi:hypothetical protein